MKEIIDLLITYNFEKIPKHVKFQFCQSPRNGEMTKMFEVHLNFVKSDEKVDKNVQNVIKFIQIW